MLRKPTESRYWNNPDTFARPRAGIDTMAQQAFTVLGDCENIERAGVRVRPSGMPTFRPAPSPRAPSKSTISGASGWLCAGRF